MLRVLEPTQSQAIPKIELLQHSPEVIDQSAHPGESETTEQDLDYDALFQTALRHQKEGKYQKAIALYTQCIELSPQIADAYVNRGVAFESIGQRDRGLKDLNKAVALNPKSQAYHNRANVYFKQGDYRKAAQEYGKALKRNPRNVDSLIYRGHSLKKLGSIDNALRDYEAVQRLAPSNADAYVGAGDIYYLRDEHDDAIENYNQTLRLDPTKSYAYFGRGACYSAKGDLDQAERDFGKALSLAPDNAYIYGARGYVFIAKGDLDRALLDLNRTMQWVDVDAYTQSVRGRLHLEKGYLDRAIQDFDKIVELDPKNLNAYNYRGVAYQRKGDLERAIHDYDAALGIRHNKEAYANRGFAWLSLSEWDKARPDLLKADHMGLNLVAAFQEDCGSAPEFEEKYNVKLPQDLANLVSIEAIPGSNSSGESVLEMFRRIRESIPYVEFDEMPPDASKN